MIKKNRKYEGVSVKLSPDQYVLLNAICDALGVNTYQIFQMFFYTLCKAAAPMHELSPEIRKVMTLMETDVGWANAFNMANPNHLHVAQAILILEQEDKRGFGAVMIDKPFMGKAPEKVDDIDPHRNNPQMTENANAILGRVCEVVMRGIYRRLLMIGGKRGSQNLSDVLLSMIDEQSTIDMEEENRIQMQGEAMYSEGGRRIEYGKRTKAKHHRTPDGEAMRQQRIRFTDEDRETAEQEVKRDSSDNEEQDFRPFDQEW